MGRWRGCVHSIAMLCEAARPLQAQRSPPAHRPDGAPLPPAVAALVARGRHADVDRQQPVVQVRSAGLEGAALAKGAPALHSVPAFHRTCHVPSWSLQYTPVQCNFHFPFPPFCPTAARKWCEACGRTTASPPASHGGMLRPRSSCSSRRAASSCKRHSDSGSSCNRPSQGFGHQH